MYIVLFKLIIFKLFKIPVVFFLSLSYIKTTVSQCLFYFVVWPKKFFEILTGENYWFSPIGKAARLV